MNVGEALMLWMAILVITAMVLICLPLGFLTTTAWTDPRPAGDSPACRTFPVVHGLLSGLVPSWQVAQKRSGFAAVGFPANQKGRNRVTNSVLTAIHRLKGGLRVHYPADNFDYRLLRGGCQRRKPNE